MQSSLGLEADLRQLGPGFAPRRRKRGYQRFADPVGFGEDAEGKRSNLVRRDKSRQELST